MISAYLTFTELCNRYIYCNENAIKMVKLT
jgi:hypothetical protein